MIEESVDGAAAAVAQHSQSNVSGKDILAQLKIGTRVVKGPDWKWGDQVIDSTVVRFAGRKFQRLLKNENIFSLAFCTFVVLYKAPDFFSCNKVHLLQIPITKYMYV